MSEGSITKKALAEGLKQMSEKKRFNKISISDITGCCGVNRQTFYYHFQDKYELVNWIYYSEIKEMLSDDQSGKDWDKNILEAIKIMKRDEHFYQNAFHITGQNSFEEFLFEFTKEIILNAVNDLAPDNNQDNKYKNFMASFYAYGMVGIIKAWAKNNMKESPQVIAGYFKELIQEIISINSSFYAQDNIECDKAKEENL